MAGLMSSVLATIIAFFCLGNQCVAAGVADVVHSSALQAQVPFNWNYDPTDDVNGLKTWTIHYPRCGGNQQSPIHIFTSKTIYKPTLRKIMFKNYNTTTPKLLLVKANHTVKVKISGELPSVTMDNTNSRYDLEQFHFHWGENNSRGSEHLLDTEILAGEVHFVHRLYAETEGPTVVVLSVLLKGGGKKHSGYEKILSNFPNITNNDDGIMISSFPLQELLPSNRSDYFQYTGSLTTPPCTEGTLWTIFRNPVTLSDDQMNTLRGLFKDNKGFLNSYRPVADLNERKVYRSFGPNSSSKVSGTIQIIFLSLFLTYFAAVDL